MKCFTIKELEVTEGLQVVDPGGDEKPHVDVSGTFDTAAEVMLAPDITEMLREPTRRKVFGDRDTVVLRCGLEERNEPWLTLETDEAETDALVLISQKYFELDKGSVSHEISCSDDCKILARSDPSTTFESLLVTAGLNLTVGAAGVLVRMSPGGWAKVTFSIKKKRSVRSFLRLRAVFSEHKLEYTVTLDADGKLSASRTID